MPSHRVQVNFSDEAYNELKAQADRRGKNMGEQLRDSLALLKWVDDAHQRGERILFERDGDVREIAWR